jgi:hypothetical protein
MTVLPGKSHEVSHQAISWQVTTNYRLPIYYIVMET